MTTEAVITKVQYDSHSVYEMMLKIHDLEKELKNEKILSASWEEKCKNNHVLVVKFNIELADSRDLVNTLTLAKKDLEDKIANLNVIFQICKRNFVLRKL